MSKLTSFASKDPEAIFKNSQTCIFNPGNFYLVTSKYCSPCQVIKKLYSEINFIEIQDDRDFNLEHGITCLPSLMIKDKEWILVASGVAEITTYLNKYLDSSQDQFK